MSNTFYPEISGVRKITEEMTLLYIVYDNFVLTVTSLAPTMWGFEGWEDLATTGFQAVQGTRIC